MNIIFFMPDEMRAESAGCYGHPVAPTPSLDAFAAQGTRFEQCHVQHSVCTPSRCSMMTGWYPHVRGHRTLWHLLRPDEPNLLRYLKQAGYQIQLYGKNHLLAPGSLADSTTTVANYGKGMFGANPYSLDDPRYYSFLFDPYKGPLAEHGDYANVQAAIKFLQSKPEQPFVLYLPLLFPHCPYCAPPHWHDAINPDDLPPLRPANLPGKPEFHRLIRETRRLTEVDDEHLRKIQAVYLGMIGFIDELFGQLLEALDDANLTEDTTVFFFSDHGDYAGDYGLVEKWPSAAEDIITRVPFVVRTPDGAAGHVVAEQIELFDLMATTLELAGLEAKHTHFSRSLVPQLQGQAGDPNRVVFTEGGYARHEPHAFEGFPERAWFWQDKHRIYHPKGKLQQDEPDSVGRSVTIRTLSHKLTYRPTGQSELYDLAADPQELYNRYENEAYRAIRQDLENQVLAWLVQTGDVTPFEEDPW